MPLNPNDLSPALRKKARAVSERLAVIQNCNLPFEEAAPLVIDALQGDSDVFWVLDECPGYFAGYSGPNAYHSTLRQVRNSPLYGPQMFASFRR